VKSYGQFCPVAKAAEIVAERWTPLVLRELLCGSVRFVDLRRGIPLMSPSLLSRRLKELEQAGAVERRNGEDGRPEYHLTEAGAELRPIIEQLGVWGQRWARSRILAHDLDAGLLMWDIHRNLRRDCLPPERTVVRFDFTGAVRSKRRWWLVIQQSRGDLCLLDPGYEVDLFLRAGLHTMTQVWMGDRPMLECLKSAEIVLEGPKDLARAFPTWLGLSLFAPVPRPTPPAPLCVAPKKTTKKASLKKHAAAS
jgi:DNA-binding HxlR family transcriptional regulator